MNRTELAAVWPPTAAVAAAAGHQTMRPLEAIRQKCLECSGGHVKEVRTCELVGCPLWPFRAGCNPSKKAPAKCGVFPRRGSGGTWIASEASLKKTPAIRGDFSESGHSTSLGSARSPADATAIAETRLQQALLDEPGSGGTQVPAEGAFSQNPVLQASAEESGHSGAAPSDVEA